VFSKAAAVNNGFQRSNPANDVIAMIDADCYISPEVILYCAARIREARRWNEKLFFVPYRHLYRLTEEATARLVASSPANALQFEIPHTLADVGSTRLAEIGHRYGALIQIFPREAFIEIGGMDPRFAGWGGEDVTLTRVLDTLYGIHETTANEVLTLWHTALGDVFLRKWAGQQDVGHNDKLSSHYRQARRDPERMRDVIDEWLLDPAYAEHRIEPLPEWHRRRHHHHHHHREPPPDGSI
jgi:glycosyltransferase involved in cell wall biosynthesis